MKEVFRDFLVFSSIAIKSRAYLEAKTNSNRLGITRFLKYITCFIFLKNDSKAIFFINKVNGFYHFPVILAVLTIYNKFHFFYLFWKNFDRGLESQENLLVRMTTCITVSALSR